MNRDNLRKVEVLNQKNEVQCTAYFHQFYSDNPMNSGSRACAILELENGELLLMSLGRIRFVS